MKLREQGVYCLPNGRELIANGTYLLPNHNLDSAVYEVNEDGRLIKEGKLTAWDISDLRDTGLTVVLKIQAS
ncbi:MAG: hypothetical protein DMF69_13345 [Acidobacteria bacterium]|nr:MAG: hypothetical protein DMF69_13345 [Acidobacteriota bacterium]